MLYLPFDLTPTRDGKNGKSKKKNNQPITGKNIITIMYTMYTQQTLNLYSIIDVDILVNAIKLCVPLSEPEYRVRWIYTERVQEVFIISGMSVFLTP